jgi:hypothetical protein
MCRAAVPWSFWRAALVDDERTDDNLCFLSRLRDWIVGQRRRSYESQRGWEMLAQIRFLHFMMWPSEDKEITYIL